MKNIVMCGGNTLFEGLATRLEKELRALAPPGSEINVMGCNQLDTKQAVWKGASAFATTSAFESRMIGADVYEDAGPSIVHRYC